MSAVSEICLGVVRSRGRWGRLVGWPDRVRGGLVLWEGGDTVILDISNIAARTVRVSSVSDDLGAAVRESDPVVANDELSVKVKFCMKFCVFE